MKIGIIGCGTIAKLHARIISKIGDATIVGVADTDSARARELADQFGVTARFGGAAELIDTVEPDVVHVLVPPQHHAVVSLLALDRRCHVLVEKPMATTVADAAEMIAAARRNDVLLCPNHSKVLDTATHRAIAVAREGGLGKIISVEASYAYNPGRNPAASTEGAEYSHWSYSLNGGLLQDIMAHPASLVVEFLDEISEIQSFARSRGVMPGGLHDEVRAIVRSGEVLGYVSVSLSERPDTIGLTIKGTTGTAQADLFNNIMTIRRQSPLPRAAARGLSGFRLGGQFLRGALANVYTFATAQVDKSGGIEPVIHQFYSAIRAKRDPPISPKKGMMVVQLMESVWPHPVFRAQKKVMSAPKPLAGGVKPTTLVTGASGFIGTHLVKRLLADGRCVRALVRPNSLRSGRMKELDVDLVEGDLRDGEVLRAATEGIDTVFHAASSMANDWTAQEEVTIKGTEALVQAAVANQVDRFVHFSSLAVFELASMRNGQMVTEDSPFRTDRKRMGAYAHAKIETERVVLEESRDRGLAATIVRPGIVVGPLGRLFFPHLGYRYQDRVFLIIGKGDNVLPLTYVDNTVDAIVRAGHEPEAIGQTYNLVDDGDVTVNQYLDRFVATTGSRPKIVHVPYMLPYLAVAGYEMAALLRIIRDPQTSRAQLRWKQARVTFDNSKAKKDLHWEPQVPILEGLNRTFDWHVSRGRKSG